LAESHSVSQKVLDLLGDGDPDPVDSSSISSSTAATDDDDIDLVVGGRSTPMCSGSLLAIVTPDLESRGFGFVFDDPSSSSSSGVT
jgi:hypothetical protein